FHGRVNDDELKALLEQADIFVMLSTQTSTGDVEGFGIAILEANAFGVPAVGARDCGIEDAINNGKSGILIDAEDGQQFLKAIQDISANQIFFTSQAV